MNLSTAIFLVNENVRCVAVAYDKTTDVRGKDVPREIKSFKTIDADVAVGDLVTIPTDTRWGYTIGKVTEVDMDVDFDSSETMRWVVGKIDTNFIDDLRAQEQEVLGRIAAADKDAKRKELAAKLKEHNPDLTGIALLTMGPVHAKQTYDPAPPAGGAQMGQTPLS